MSSQPKERTELVARLSYELGRELSARTVMFHSAVAGKLGLSVTEHKTLDLLSRNGPVSAGRLAELTGLTGGAITGMIDRLEKAGFVERTADPKDRRKVIVQSVDAKYDDVAWIFDSLGKAMNELLMGYSDDELAVIADFIVRIPQLMDKETRKLQEA